MAALLLARGMTHLLTFNGQDFRRYPDLTPLDPRHPASFPAA